jgi:hypothetical protein
MEQAPNNKTPDLIDTTDCLEAIDVIRWMKNFFFLIVIICLLVNAAVFCLDRFEHIGRSGCDTCGFCPSACRDMTCKTAQQIPVVDAEKIRDAAQAVVADAQSAQAAPAPADPNARTPRPLPAIFRYKPRCQDVAVALKISNFILILAAAMYCLTLLMGLKISLTGRLGGINHISRAFFLSMFAFVVLLPWQVVLPGVVIGAMFTPCELLCNWYTAVQNSNFWLVLCYFRFAGLWFAAVILFAWAQLRSAKWSRFTLRRLGLIR